MPATCIDLAEKFGETYRTTYEESYYAERGDGAWAHDPWLCIIPCRHGHIGPWGGSRLCASTSRRGNVARALRSLPCCQVEQDGSDGVTVLFDVADFETVAELMQPHRKRRMTPEQRQAAVDRLAAYRFTAAVTPQGLSAVCVPQAPVDSGAMPAAGGVL
jgi:hypothetical protein